MSEDMFDAMRIGIIVNRGLRRDTTRPTSPEMLAWATRNAAQALQREDLGTLEPGKKADLTVVRTDRAHLTPLLDVISNLVHYGQASDVESVMVDGEWIMKDGKVLTMDEAAVTETAQEAALHGWRNLHQESPDIGMVPEFQDLLI